MTIDIPAHFAALHEGSPADPRLTPEFPRHGMSGSEWLEGLPRIIAKALRRWELSVDHAAPSPIRTGSTSIVIDVLTPDDRQAVLKVSRPFLESAYEHLALREWDGRGMVRLEAAEPKDYALLLERLDSANRLSSTSILDSCEIIGTMIRTLDRPASPRFDTLVDRSRQWEEELSENPAGVPRRLITQARSHMHDLVLDIDEDVVDGSRLIHTDLHDAHVLAPLDARRGSWLAIDPRAMAGELAFMVAPMVWNRAEETARAHNPRSHVRMRAGIISDVAGLDEDRVRAWTFVRLVHNAVWAAKGGDDDLLTRSIFLAKMFDQ